MLMLCKPLAMSCSIVSTDGQARHRECTETVCEGEVSQQAVTVSVEIASFALSVFPGLQKVLHPCLSFLSKTKSKLPHFLHSRETV